MGSVCGGTKGKYHDSSGTRPNGKQKKKHGSSADLDFKVKEFLDKDHIREMEIKHHKKMTFKEIFGEKTTSWIDIKKV
jgi:hypothetical protein